MRNTRQVSISNVRTEPNPAEGLSFSSAGLSEVWQTWLERPRWKSFPRWIDWQLTKKLAIWGGREIKRSVPMFWGEPMTIVYPEFVSGRLGRHGYFERDLTAAMINLLEPGDVFYDVGSHFGFYSLLASRIVGARGAVHAFEPTPETFHVLSENASQVATISTHNCAVYDRPTTLKFWIEAKRHSPANFVVSNPTEIRREALSQGTEIEVQAVRLDDFAIDHRAPNLIKLDVEGAESHALCGMLGLLTNHRPTVFMEVGDDVNQKTGNVRSRDNVDLLLDHGYLAWEYLESGPVPHRPRAVYEFGNLMFVHPSNRRQPSIAGVHRVDNRGHAVPQ